jgi:glycosyltransferase involved in cell wall biosynthesis
MSMDKKPTLCIAILTLNEERRIKKCIQSAQFADQIIVADSGSTDNTAALATAMGAAVYSHPDWQGFGEQRTRLFKHCSADYIFFLDADEAIPPELEREITDIVRSGASGVWEVLWNQVAYGKPLTRMKSTGGIPRLFRADNLIGYEGLVHEAAVLRDKTVPVYKLKARLFHYSRETIYGSLQKLAQYAQLGALKRAKRGKTGGVLRGFASALANFLQLYIFRRGFLCGPEGFLFCFFIALECFFRYAMIEYDKGILNESAKR